MPRKASTSAYGLLLSKIGDFKTSPTYYAKALELQQMW